MNAIPQRSAQSVRASSAACSLPLSSSPLIGCAILVSSNLRIISAAPPLSSRSLMNIRKSKGPNTLPWGTPDRTAAHSEASPLRTTRCCLSFSHALIQLNSCPLMPWAQTFFSSRLTGTLSKAFAKSSKIMSTASPLSTAAVTFSRKESRLLAQDLPRMNPCCDGLISLFLSRCLTTSSFMIDSIILQHTEVRETGL